MKKMIISLIACAILVFCSFLAWSCYHDILAAFLFIFALLPSCYFEQGREEYADDHKRHGGC